MKIETYTDYRVPNSTITNVIDNEQKIMIIKKDNSCIVLDNSSVLSNNNLIKSLPKAKQIAIRLVIESDLAIEFNITPENEHLYKNY